MRKQTLLVVGLATALVCSSQALVPTTSHAQTPAAPTECSKTWVGHEAEFENALRDGKITKMEVLPIGVTKPQRATLDPSTPAAHFAWKLLPPGFKNGFMESYKAEVAAYELDKLLELHMVPPVVSRKVDGLSGAAVYWIEKTKSWDKDHPPSGPEPQWSFQITRMKMLDLLIGNIDRNQGNLIYDSDWHLFLIDHSRAFTGKKDLKNIAPMARVDRALWTRMQALTIEDLQKSLGEWVGGGDLKAMLVRREEMAKAIQKLVTDRGEASVFFN